MTGQSRGILVLVTPLLVYTMTVAAGGNGFVAAFVYGIAFRSVGQTAARRHESSVPDASDFRLVEDTSWSMTMSMWFVFGNATVLALCETRAGQAYRGTERTAGRCPPHQGERAAVRRVKGNLPALGHEGGHGDSR
ncbi:hypothetical protein AB0E74_21410 [Streptomyces sp. NPDC030392]|uniref:hypothetical protein n=1 Tax=Streptomyces sp. NPDC030392 TaxID=3155468 RepID=UPI003409CB7A